MNASPAKGVKVLISTGLDEHPVGNPQKAAFGPCNFSGSKQVAALDAFVGEINSSHEREIGLGRTIDLRIPTNTVQAIAVRSGDAQRNRDVALYENLIVANDGSASAKLFNLGTDPFSCFFD
jgi:hypothetical protein